MAKKFEIKKGFPTYTHYIDVGWDKIGFGKENYLIGTNSIVSCLAVTLYWPKKKRGILAHVTGDSKDLMPEKVVDILLRNILSERLSVNKDKEFDYGSFNNYGFLEASLAGETMDFTGHAKSMIIREKLNKYGIPIIGEDLSSIRMKGRLVFLHCNSGNVEVYRA